MHDIWNPWHGCRKISEGCLNCYMYFLDRLRNQDGSLIFRTSGFEYPLQKDMHGNYKVQSGEMLRVCMTSDFFLEEADEWREEAWRIIKKRSDVVFFLLTKRAERIPGSLPSDWGDGWENVFLNVTAENQRRADERIPVLLSVPAKHRGVMTAPLIGEVRLGKYLDTGLIEEVIAGGENYDGARPCRWEWVKILSDECRARDILFAFIETGNVFIRDGKSIRFRNKREQSVYAFRSGLSYEGRRPVFSLTQEEPDLFGISEYVPYFGRTECAECGMRIICNGCSGCGKCNNAVQSDREKK